MPAQNNPDTSMTGLTNVVIMPNSLRVPAGATPQGTGDLPADFPQGWMTKAVCRR